MERVESLRSRGRFISLLLRVTFEDQSTTMKNIYVGNLTFQTSEDELKSLFEQYGQVDKVSIVTDKFSGQSRGFGFVEMTNDEEGGRAIEALNGQAFGGRNLTVNEARPREPRFGGGGGGGRGFGGGGGGREGGGGRGGRGGREGRGGGGGGRDRW